MLSFNVECGRGDLSKAKVRVCSTFTEPFHTQNESFHLFSRRYNVHPTNPLAKAVLWQPFVREI